VLPQNVSDVLQQFTLINSLLAAFAIAIAVQLISLRDTQTITSVTVAVFLVASLALLVSITGYIRVTSDLLLMDTPTADAVTRTVESSDASISYGASALGVTLFYTGVGLVGWLHSRRLGILSTTCALVAFILVAALERI
jgi:hypothetical protein